MLIDLLLSCRGHKTTATTAFSANLDPAVFCYSMTSYSSAMLFIYTSLRVAPIYTCTVPFAIPIISK